MAIADVSKREKTGAHQSSTAAGRQKTDAGAAESVSCYFRAISETHYTNSKVYKCVVMGSLHKMLRPAIVIDGHGLQNIVADKLYRWLFAQEFGSIQGSHRPISLTRIKHRTLANVFFFFLKL